MKFQIGIETRYQMFNVHPETGEETVLSGEFGNTLLTSGRNELGKRDWFTSCKVGTDNTTPSSGQTNLLGYVAGTNVIEETVSGAQASSPYYGWKRKRFRFGIGEAAGNLNEVCIGWGTDNTDNAVTRALTEDIDGNQNTIVPKADEYLDVVVEVRMYPPLVDATGTVVFNSVTYNYTARAASVTSVEAWGNKIGDKIESYSVTDADWSAFDDDIGTITQGPSGVQIPSDNSNDYTNAYAENSYQIKGGMNVGAGTNDVDGWNVTTGKLMRSIIVKTTGGYYQVQFDSQSSPGNGVPKTSNFTLKFQYVLGWDEATIP